MKSLKSTLKRILPNELLILREKYIYRRTLKLWNKFWNNRALKYGDISKSKEALAALILAEAHVIQKGITMPNRRLGFGLEKARSLIHHLNEYIQHYSKDDDVIKFAVSDLSLYVDVHNKNEYTLPDDINVNISSLINQVKFIPQEDRLYNKSEIFKDWTDFRDFAASRHSIRNFSSESIEIERIIDAVKLAQTAPSACNRQGVRVKIISSEDVKNKVLSIQNGNRGFGQFADKILLLTFEQGACEYEYRTSGYIDVGIFAMNLLYTLHVNGICACTLNAHLTISQHKQLQSILGYNNSEMPALFIAIGNPLPQFRIAKSERYSTNVICDII